MQLWNYFCPTLYIDKITILDVIFSKYIFSRFLKNALNLK